MTADKKHDTIAGNLQELPASLHKTAAYEVGYGKPPKEHRFRKGQSGNPRGRPRGSRNRRPEVQEERLRKIILDEAYRGIDIREGDRTLTVPMARAVTRSIAHNAVKGRHHSQPLFTRLVEEVERRNAADAFEPFCQAALYKENWENELGRRQRLGITDLPDPIPHPDHVHLYVRRGTARITGPMTREEKRRFEGGAEIWAEHFHELPRLRRQLKQTRSEAKRKRLSRKITEMQRFHNLLEEVIPIDMRMEAMHRIRTSEENKENEEE